MQCFLKVAGVGVGRGHSPPQQSYLQGVPKIRGHQTNKVSEKNLD